MEPDAAEANKSKRRTFTHREKLCFLGKVRRRVVEGLSMRKACEELRISPKRYREWKRAATVLSQRNPNAKTICKGRASILAPIEEELLKYVFEMREQGIEVDNNTLVLRVRASSLRGFTQKSRHAQLQIVGRFMKQTNCVF